MLNVQIIDDYTFTVTVTGKAQHELFDGNRIEDEGIDPEAHLREIIRKGLNLTSAEADEEPEDLEDYLP